MSLAIKNGVRMSITNPKWHTIKSVFGPYING